MRLLDRTFLIVFIGASLVLTGAAVIQYYTLRQKIEQRVDKRLLKEKQLIGEQLEDIKIRPGFSYQTARSSVEVIENEIDQGCVDSLFYGKLTDVDGEVISYRILQTCIQIDQDQFRIQIKKEVEETNTFISNLFWTSVLTLVGVLILFLLLKFLVLKNVWNPFFQSLEKLKDHDLQRNMVRFDTNVNIREFRELNIELSRLADRIYTEYQDQKGFVENANHELMTPIAVISNKLELLVQSNRLGQEEILLVNDIMVKLNKLSRINRALVLISKIDHHQFPESENVNLLENIDEALNMMEDQIRSKQIKVRKQIVGTFHAEINPDLADILALNLIKNAVTHNLEQGFIEIDVQNNSLVIRNSGEPMTARPSDMFRRFVRNTTREESTGLGMSIMQKICQTSGLHIDYQVNDSTHHITITRSR